MKQSDIDFYNEYMIYKEKYVESLKILVSLKNKWYYKLFE